MSSFLDQLKQKRAQRKAEISNTTRTPKTKKEAKQATTLKSRGGRTIPKDYIAPPDLRVFDLPMKVQTKIMDILASHLELTHKQRELKAQKDVLSTQLKEMCEEYHLDRFQTDGVQATYYTINRTKINKEQLIAANVPLTTILRCTTVSTSVAIKVSEINDDNSDREDEY